MIQKHLQMVQKFLKVASITKKITLAIIGLFLMSFIVVHLGINLCLLRNDGGEWFRIAAHFMGTNYIIKVFEVVLFGAILLHIALALLIQFFNWRARPIGYASCSRSKTAFGSKLMIWSGLLVALFIGVHLVNFWFVKVGWTEGRYVIESKALSNAFNNTLLFETHNGNMTEEEQAKFEQKFDQFETYLENNESLKTAIENAFLFQTPRYVDDLSKADVEAITAIFDVYYEPDFYVMVRDLFKNKWIVLLYLFFMVALGFHLAHAFPSAFQTLGLAHSKYTWIIKIIGTGFALIVSVGFAIIPVYFYFIY